MERRAFIKSSVAFGLSEMGKDHSAQPNPDGGEQWNLSATPKPHIIFIMTDQHRGDALGCMGHPSVISPHIDGLAKEGSLFVHGYASTPSSTPARAGLLTGLSPWHHGMLGYGRVAEKYRYEMPQMMRNLGYYTFGIGKMHWFPQKALHGFHATLLDESGRSETPYFMSEYREWFQLHAPGQNPDATGIGWNDHKAGIYQLDEALHPTTWTGQTACELIRNYNNDKPLFLKVSFARPHSPYDPPKRYIDLYKDKDIPPPAVGDWCGEFAERLDPLSAASDAPFGNFGEDYAINSRRHYYANITFIDDQVGAIIQTLKDKGMYEQAVICFTADHGDMLGDHHHWRKTYPYEGSVHVPYIVKWPSGMTRTVADGAFIKQPVELRDFLPTFIDLAGGSVPPDMDGMSLRLLMQGETAKWRKHIDLEHATCYREENYWCALTDGKMKYIWNFHTGHEQLFDLQHDPIEQHNCIADRAYAGKLSTWRQAMVEHLSERGESFVKDGKLKTRTSTLLYSPHYPNENMG